MDDVTVCIATFGAETWSKRALSVAYPSAQHQAKTVVVHGDSLHGARNQAAHLAQTEWLVFLDADDELAPGYVDAMLAASGDLRAPRLVEIRGGGEREVPLTDRHIEHLNPCCIGTMIRRHTLLDCGGFPDFPAWEDFALFLRAYRRGASIEHVPGAVYRAHVRPGSRNRTVTDGPALHRRIREWA